MLTIHNVKTNESTYRRETFDGASYYAFPAVLAVEGVLNNALVTAEELGKYVNAWNGRPVPVLHPEERGKAVSANSPEILERAVGWVFNAKVEDKRLKAELWLNETKMDRFAPGVLSRMAEGGLIEVSTGYYSDAIQHAGDHEGKPYTMIHKNIRPDHLALLPGEVGACSIEDGCGAPRTNRKQEGVAVKVNQAFDVIKRALGLNVNCACQGEMMDVMKVAEELKANGALSAKQFEALQGMDEGQRGMVGAILSALDEQGKAEAKAAAKVAEEKAAKEAKANEDEDDEEKAMKQNKADTVTMTKAEISDLVANAVREALSADAISEQVERAEIVGRLTANKANPLSDVELKAMTTESLRKLDKALQPADYSGSGGFAANSHGGGSVDDAPLTINHGIFRGAHKKEAN